MTGYPPALPALTSVRFLLALGVVLFHYHLQWSWNDMAVTGLFNRARLGVDVFFILSGFVLTHAYRDAIGAGRLDYPRFLIARLARIYPAHIAVLALVGAMVGAASVLGAQFDPRYYNLPGLFATLLLVQAWTPGWVFAEWNGPSWSLSAEWFAYLAFPVYAALGYALRRRPLVLLALAGLLFIALDLAYQALFGDILVRAESQLGVLRIIPAFLYGVGLYRLGERWTPKRTDAIAAAWVSGLTVLMLMHLSADDRWISAASGLVVLTLGQLSKAGADGALAKPWMLAAGEASYALYLLHMPVLIGWKGVMSHLTGQPSDYVFAWWELALLLPLTTAAAFGLYYGFEAPARRWIRGQTDRLWPPVAPDPRSQRHSAGLDISPPGG